MASRAGAAQMRKQATRARARSVRHRERGECRHRRVGFGEHLGHGGQERLVLAEKSPGAARAAGSIRRPPTGSQGAEKRTHAIGGFAGDGRKRDLDRRSGRENVGEHRIDASGAGRMRPRGLTGDAARSRGARRTSPFAGCAPPRRRTRASPPVQAARTDRRAQCEHTQQVRDGQPRRASEPCVTIERGEIRKIELRVRRQHLGDEQLQLGRADAQGRADRLVVLGGERDRTVDLGAPEVVANPGSGSGRGLTVLEQAVVRRRPRRTAGVKLVPIGRAAPPSTRAGGRAPSKCDHALENLEVEHAAAKHPEPFDRAYGSEPVLRHSRTNRCMRSSDAR